MHRVDAHTLSSSDPLQLKRPGLIPTHPDAVLGVAGSDVRGDSSDLGFQSHLSVMDEDALLSRGFWDST